MAPHTAFETRYIYWNEQTDQAFPQLKEALTSAPILAPPNFMFPSKLEANDFGRGVSAIFMKN